MNYVIMFTSVLWQHVVFLCVSRKLFRMSLVIVVRLNAVQRGSHVAQHKTYNHNKAHSKHRTTHTQNTTCCHSTEVNITK